MTRFLLTATRWYCLGSSALAFVVVTWRDALGIHGLENVDALPWVMGYGFAALALYVVIAHHEEHARREPEL